MFKFSLMGWEEFVLWVSLFAPQFIADYVEPEPDDWRDYGWPI